MKISVKIKLLGVFLCLSILLAACGGGGGSSDFSGQGTLSTSLTDSSTEDYRAVYVTVDEVAVHSDVGGWQTVATPGGTYNLLELVNGVRENLGVATLDSGIYNQMRLLLGETPDNGMNILNIPHPQNVANYLIDQSNAVHELKVPSGFQTGIKIVHGFVINENQTTELILDFDAMKSVVKAGKSGKHLLKPTIKVLRTEAGALLSGLVSDGSNGLEGALVSAQTYNNNLSLDAAKRVQLVRSTISADDDVTTADDETGEYQLFLPAGSYNLLAYLSGYQPLCLTGNLNAGRQVAGNFPLTVTQTGTVSGTADIVSSTAVADQHITIDFRQSGLCADPTDMINVRTVAVEDGGEYEVELPVGSYQMVASTAGQTTLITTIIVSASATTQHNIAF